MQENSNIEHLLTERGVKPTANRLLVLKQLLAETHPVSLSELEEKLETLDKSSIFRALTLFLEHHVVHAFEDGNGIIKYEACRNPHGCSIDDMHVHFFCEKCHRTFCLPVHIPQLPLPEGYQLHTVNYMAKGLCASCAGQA